jgi:hypothetical protein
MSLIIAKGSYKKEQFFCQTSSYKKGRRKYFLGEDFEDTF